MKRSPRCGWGQSPNSNQQPCRASICDTNFCSRSLLIVRSSLMSMLQSTPLLNHSKKAAAFLLHKHVSSFENPLFWPSQLLASRRKIQQGCDRFPHRFYTTKSHSQFTYNTQTIRLTHTMRNTEQKDLFDTYCLIYQQMQQQRVSQPTKYQLPINSM